MWMLLWIFLIVLQSPYDRFEYPKSPQHQSSTNRSIVQQPSNQQPYSPYVTSNSRTQLTGATPSKSQVPIQKPTQIQASFQQQTKPVDIASSGACSRVDASAGGSSRTKAQPYEQSATSPSQHHHHLNRPLLDDYQIEPTQLPTGTPLSVNVAQSSYHNGNLNIQNRLVTLTSSRFLSISQIHFPQPSATRFRA